MMPSYSVGLAALDQSLQRKQARRLQHPVARHRVAFRYDQRFINKAAEVLQDVPTVDSMLIFCNELGALKASGF